MDDWVEALERVLEQYILKYKSLELNPLGQSLASIAGCLDKFFCIRKLHGTKECWESGEAIIGLKMQCEELKVEYVISFYFEETIFWIQSKKS